MSEIFRPYKSFPTQKYFKTLPEKEWFGEANGIATLDENGKLSPDQIPSGVGDSHNKGWFATPDTLPSTGVDGDYAIVGSTDTVWIWDSDTSTWVNSGSSGQVESVNDKTGVVVLNAKDIKTTETIVLVGEAGTTVEAAIATVAQNANSNKSAITATNVRTNFISTDVASHTTTIGGILDIVDNDSIADIKKNGISIFDSFATTESLATKADKADVANISTEGNVTNISDTLNVGGGISNGNAGTITTGSISAAEELETKTLVLSGNNAVKIDTFDTTISTSSTDTGVPTSKAVYTVTNGLASHIYSIDASKANIDATNISGDNLTKWKEKLELDILEADINAKQDKAFKIGETDVTVEGLLVEQKSALDQTYIETANNAIVIKGQALIPQLVSNLVRSLSSTSTDNQYPSAKAVYNYSQAKVSSTVEINIKPTESQTATAITGALAKPARVVVVPNINNIGAVYIKESTEYSSTNPIYPDPTNNVYEFTDMSAVNIFVDSIGDSVDLVIEYRG